VILTSSVVTGRVGGRRTGAGRRAWRVTERNVHAYGRRWFQFASGFAEPLLFLLSIGVGVGALVGDITVGGRTVDYATFVAPGMLATAAMNGVLYDITFNFFVKYKYHHTFDAMIATPVGSTDVVLGEVMWSILRGAVYSLAFVGTMWALGDIASWWAVLAFPAAVLIAFGFAGAGVAATTYMRSFVDFDLVMLVMIPLFLFSATFFPLDQYPDALQWVIRATPLYQGVALERALVLGEVSWALLGHAAYLVAMGAAGLAHGTRRMARLLNP